MPELNDHVFHANRQRHEQEIHPEQRYADTVTRLARELIYENGRLDHSELERAMTEAKRNPALREFEEKRHEIESLAQLLRGIKAHEAANMYHNGTWQSALIRQPARARAGRELKPPERLTREDVAEEFDAYEFRDRQVDAEAEAVERYEALLTLRPDAKITLSRRTIPDPKDTEQLIVQEIAIDHTDIETLLVDLRVRMAERIADPVERKNALKQLDKQFSQIIERVEDRGKRFELEEIYVLRRLVHASDTGHLVSISHGTPREDLRPDRGSVDVEVAAAGDVYAFQMKTYHRGVSGAKRDEQRQSLARAKERIKGMKTHFVVLTAEDVSEVYDASRRQPDLAKTSRRDKYEALHPITDQMKPRERSKLLTLLGLTEEGLLEEEAEFNRKQQEMNRLWAERSAKQEAERQRHEAAEAARLAEEERARTEEETRRREKEEAIARQQLEATLASQQERDRLEALRIEREKRAQQNAKEGIRRAEERERLEREEAAERERIAARIAKGKVTRERKKMEHWHGGTLADLKLAALLSHVGLTPKDPEFLAAKKRLVERYAKPPKNGNATEACKPNAAFYEDFPTSESYASPSEETLERVLSQSV